MSRIISREELFQQVLAEKATGEETVEQLREFCTEAGMFEHDRGLKRAGEAYMDRVIRGLARQRGWVDRAGEPMRLFNVVRDDPKTGKPKHLYVDLKIASVADCVYIYEDRKAKADYFSREAEEIRAFATEKYGRKFQRLIQFD